MGETESTRYAWVRELDTQSEDAEVKLVAFLGDPSWRVRQEAVNAIGKYGVTQSLVERLIQARWEHLSKSSPNLSVTEPEARVYVAGNQRAADVRGLMNLLFAGAMGAQS